MPMVARRMVRVVWLYFFFQLIADVFVSVHVIEQTRSLQSLVLFRWVYFFGAFLAFAVFGAFFPRLGLPMRWGYIGSFSLYLVSTFLLLIFPQELAYFLVFSFFQ